MDTLSVVEPDFIPLMAVVGVVFFAVIGVDEVVMHLSAHVFLVDFPDVAAGVIAIEMIPHGGRTIIDSHHGHIIVVIIVMVMMRSRLAGPARRRSEEAWVGSCNLPVVKAAAVSPGSDMAAICGFAP